LSGDTGSLQSDAYEVYTKPGVKGRNHAGCWAHARRKFTDAGKAAPKEAPCAQSLEMLGIIAKLYEVEKQARELDLQDTERLALRLKREVPSHLETIKKHLMSIRLRVLPQSLLAKACDDALNQWEHLVLYATDGTIEIDNNWRENAMRPVALGRKNWLHFGSQESGPVVAAILSLIASAQRAGLNVRVYLADVLRRMADPDFKSTQINELLPKKLAPGLITAPEAHPVLESKTGLVTGLRSSDFFVRNAG
jgi:hypothetical protein